MFQTLVLVPAYGRKYATPAEMLADWEAGKDFKIVAGPYVNRDDVKAVQIEADPLGQWLYVAIE